ncbi:hypothetical protein PPACK8108_LOCUS8069 [Phakopsora pachyrhizi]|uniref:Uncharacterized protein n=1 Tax=Phakopsora pachyrhizi TaxID=170000 RepID=A0AAV0AU09_PHAPC|nr:hypothetical protein PPACK8108_LOCUS8069 [Phakopsora pachyrhizi]
MESLKSTTTRDDVCSRQGDSSGPSTTSRIFRQDSSSITERDTRGDSKDGSDDDELGDKCFDKVSEKDSSEGEIKEDFPSQLFAVHPIDLPSLTPSQSNKSTSDSDSDSISDGLTDINNDNDDEKDFGRLHGGLKKQIGPLSLNNSNKHQLNSFSDSLLSRNWISRPKSGLSDLVTLRYSGRKGESEIGDEKRGLLALDLDAYISDINSTFGGCLNLSLGTTLSSLWL